MLDFIAENKLADNAKARGEQLMSGLRTLQAKFPIIGDVRGIGLMVGAEFVHADKSPAFGELDELLEALKDRGFIVGKNGVGRNVLAFQPPLVITARDIDDVLNAIELILTERNYGR